MFGRAKAVKVPITDKERAALEFVSSGGWQTSLVVCMAGLDPEESRAALRSLASAGLVSRQLMYGVDHYQITGAGRRYLR
jgi:predicted transcriptional regulator